MQAAAAKDPLVGRSIGGVVIEAKLGEGAMGVVYRGAHPGLKRAVAVKLLGARSGDNAKERFVREGQAAARVRHANVVQVFDAGEQNGVAFLIMELVNGHSLGAILDEKKTLDPEVVAKLAIGIADGLAAIHATGVIHRDLKPDNILLGVDEQVKIADLGLAKTMDDPDLLRLTGSGMVVGTPLYVSPEAIRDPGNLDGQADMYSLGATLYHLLTGQPPFALDTPYDVMRAHMELRPQPVRSRNPAVPVWLATLVESCLDKQPQRRPTAAGLAERLRARRASRRWHRLRLPLSLAAAALVAASVTWLLVKPAPPAVVIGGGATLLTLDAAMTPLRWKTDDGPWMSGTMAVMPGAHRLVVESARPGPLQRWIETLTVGNEPLRLTPQFRLVDANLRVPVPGIGGMVYCEGEGRGADATHVLRHAGTWRFGRWTGQEWWTVEVSPEGAMQESGPFAKPRGPAWWRTIDGDGEPLALPFHGLTWWESDAVIRREDLLPPGWQSQGDRPEQPGKITEGSAAALAAINALRSAATLSGGRMPTPGEARGLSELLRSPVWMVDGGEPRTTRSGPALIVMICADPADIR